MSGEVTFNENDFGHKEMMTTTDKVAEPKQIVKQEVVTVKLETEEEEETEETRESNNRHKNSGGLEEHKEHL